MWVKIKMTFQCVSVQLFRKLTLVFFVLLFGIKESFSLRNARIVAPEAVARGYTVQMRCEYELEAETLYSVKWYRGDREFCRYMPRDVPPVRVFEIPGIDVDITRTDAHNLTFVASKRVAAGGYTCEASADEPSFQTARLHTYLYVVDLPDSGPDLTGMKHRYRPGMKYKAECVTRNSYPAANLSFFVNNEPANDQHVWRRVEVLENKRLNSYGIIQFVVNKNSFVDNRLRVRCTATIYSVYHQSHQVSAEEILEHTTPGPLAETDKIVVYPIHRPRETSDGRRSLGDLSTVLFRISPIVIYVHCKLYYL